MSKVKIQGHASGTGVLTVTAPNTSTDRTITLPDGDVTLGAATPSIDDNGNATAITIDSSENVGIGINANIDSELHVYDASTSRINIEAGDGDAVLKLECSGESYWYISNDTSDSNKLTFFHNGGETPLTLDSSGGVKVSGLVLDKTSQSVTEGGQITHNGCSFMSLNATSGGISFAAAQIQNPYWEGQILVLRYSENPPARFTLSSSSGSGGVGAITLSGDWSPDWGDTLTLVASGTTWWNELSRSTNTNY